MAKLPDIEFKITRQGDVKMSHCIGYLVHGGDDTLCFYIDPVERAYVSWSTSSYPSGEVTIGIGSTSTSDSELIDTEIEFPTLVGWQFHAGGAGKSIALSFVKETK